jgi:hypothetical protein
MREQDAGRGGSGYSQFCRGRRDKSVGFQANLSTRMPEL